MKESYSPKPYIDSLSDFDNLELPPAGEVAFVEHVLTFLRLERLRRGLSQEAFADALSITGAAWSKIERGETELTLTRLYQACQILQVDPIEALLANPEPKQYAKPFIDASEVDFRLRKVLIDFALKGETVNYTELVHRLQLPVSLELQMGWEKLGVMLSNICLFEFYEGRPLLSVLVIDEAIAEPRYGFYNLARDLGHYSGGNEDEGPRKAYYRRELARTFRYWQHVMCKENQIPPAS